MSDNSELFTHVTNGVRGDASSTEAIRQVHDHKIHGVLCKNVFL